MRDAFRRCLALRSPNRQHQPRIPVEGLTSRTLLRECKGVPKISLPHSLCAYKTLVRENGQRGNSNSYVGSVWCATGYCDKNPFQSNSSRHCGRDHEKGKSSKSSATYSLWTSVTSQVHQFNKSWTKQGAKSLDRFEDSRRKSLGNNQTRPLSHRTNT